MANPAKAIDAILDGKKEVGGFTIYPLSVARYALLEKHKSPLLTGNYDTQGVITTLYIMTQPAKTLVEQSAKGTFEIEATNWADTLDFKMLDVLVEEVKTRLTEVFYLAPEGNDEGGGKKKAQMGG